MLMSCGVQKSTSVETLQLPKMPTRIMEHENIKRIQAFKKDTLVSVKLKAMKEELLNNNVYVFLPKIIQLLSDTRELITLRQECFIICVLAIRKKAYLLLASTKEKLTLLTPKKIDSITVLEDEKAVAIYGAKGICGVVVLHSSNRKLNRKMKNL